MTEPDHPPSTCRFAVPRADLLAALEPFRKMLRKNTKQDAVLDAVPGGIEISGGGISTVVSGEGVWERRVSVPGPMLAGLARALPPVDPIELVVTRDRLLVGELSLPCRVMPLRVARVELPMEPTLAELLALRQTHGSMVIEQSGYERALESARAKRDKLVAKATEILAPLGVKEGDVRWAVERVVRRAGKAKPVPGQVWLFERKDAGE